jgi:hypothetical protein
MTSESFPKIESDGLARKRTIRYRAEFGSDFHGFVGSLDYLHINPEVQDPARNTLVVIPGFTQGIEVFEGFGEALGEGGTRNVYVLDQPERYKKTFDKKFMGELGLNDQVDALMEFIYRKGLTDKPADFVANSFATSILAEAAGRADELGWSTFKASEGSNTFFIATSGVNLEENKRTLGVRWVKWMAKNASSGKTLDPTGEMMKAGVKNALGDIRKTANEAIALSSYKVDFAELERAGVRPIMIGYADDDLMPFQETTAHEGAVSLIDNTDTAPTLPNGGPYPGAKDFEDFKNKTGLSGKEAKQAWLHHYRAAEHNDMQFHPNRTASFILQTLLEREKSKTR